MSTTHITVRYSLGMSPTHITFRYSLGMSLCRVLQFHFCWCRFRHRCRRRCCRRFFLRPGSSDSGRGPRSRPGPLATAGRFYRGRYISGSRIGSRGFLASSWRRVLAVAGADIIAAGATARSWILADPPAGGGVSTAATAIWIQYRPVIRQAHPNIFQKISRAHEHWAAISISRRTTRKR